MSGQNSTHLNRRAVLAGMAALGMGCVAPVRAPTASSSGDQPQWPKSYGGTVVNRGAADYELWRQGMPWQGWVADRRPQCIVRPLNRQQLRDALEVARRSGMKVALRSGGHSVSEVFLRDDGMLLDLNEFRAMSVDTATATAWVEPALWSRDMLQQLAVARLAFPAAHCATLPMGGYLLGGGIGNNGDHWGIGCHSIIGAEIMLADGSIVTATAQQHPELFWAVRGAGMGFFGIVLRYHLQCQPLPSDMRDSIYAFPLQRAGEVAAWMADIAQQGMANTEMMLILSHNAQAAASASAIDRKMCIARIATFCDTAEQSTALLAPLANSPMAQSAAMRLELQPSSFEQMMIGSVDAARGLGFGRSAVNTIWTSSTAAAANAIAPLLVDAPSSKSHIIIAPRHNLTLRADACFSRIAAGFIGCYGVWDHAEHDDANFAWLKRMNTAMEDFATGNYINEIDAFSYPEKVQRSFSAEAFARLGELRRRFDPGGLFHSFPGQ